MRYPDRVTVCVSSQAGCGMACPFCATGQAGLTRNLSTAEIVEQVVAAGRAAAHRRGRAAPGGRGPGLATWSSWGWGSRWPTTSPGGRRPPSHRTRPGRTRHLRGGVTVSTVGLVPAIERLAAEELPVTLALSLHAPDDELRDELVPINTRWKVAQALDAARAYAATTGRRVSHRVRADPGRQRPRLARRPARSRARPPRPGWVHVNPIPLNPTPGSRWTASDPARAGRVRRPAAGARRPRHGPRHPRPGDRRGLRAAGRHDLTS